MNTSASSLESQTHLRRRMARRWRLFTPPALGVLAGVFAAMLPSRVSGEASPLGDFNVVVRNNFSTTADVEGKIAVKNFTGTNSFTAVKNQSVSPSSTQTFLIQSGAVAGNSINLQNGSLYAPSSSAMNGRSVNYNGGGTFQTTTSTDLNALFNQIVTSSANYATLTSNGTVTIPTSPAAVTFVVGTLDANNVAIFSVDGNSLFNNSNVQQIDLNLNGKSPSAILINVTGTSVSYVNSGNFVGNMNSTTWRSKLLWNFHQATTLTANKSFYGTVLAPLASVTISGGANEGAVAANNLTANIEVHLPNFVGGIVLPTTDYGDYPSFGSASQTANAALRIGTNPTDADAANPTTGAATADDTTGTDDEDLTIPAQTLGITNTYTFPVTLSGTATSARIGAWADWNGDGDASDSNETLTVTPSSLSAGTTSVTVSMTPPSSVSTGVKYLRLRLAEGTTAPSFTGTSTARGEVEDHAVLVNTARDYGDWNGSGAGTTSAYTVVSTAVRLGALVDGETTATANADATADDASGYDDEDGVDMPQTILRGQSVTIPVSVFNNNTTGKYLMAWIDFNNDGTFTNSAVTSGGERVYSATTPASASLQTVNVTFTVPAGASLGAARGVRFRLTNSSSTTPVSFGATGETEDYVVTIADPVDYGDWSGSGALSSSTSSIVNANLRLGATVDAETSATVNATATGDDSTGSDDEDGLIGTPILTAGAKNFMTLQLKNATGANAYVNGWIDFNNDGDFNDSGEQVVTNVIVANATDTSTFAVQTSVPANAVTGTPLGFRLRLTAATGAPATGAFSSGEVEDYTVTVDPMVPVSCPQNITFWCGNAKPVDAYGFDHGFIDYLRKVGHTVTLAVVSASGTSLVNAETGAVVSPNAAGINIVSNSFESEMNSNSAGVTAALRATTRPVLLMTIGGVATSSSPTTAVFQSIEYTAPASDVVIPNGFSPILPAGWPTGSTVTIQNSPSLTGSSGSYKYLTYGSGNTGGATIGAYYTGTTKILYMRYEAGATLADNSAAAGRRVYLGIPQDGASAYPPQIDVADSTNFFSALGRQLIDRAIAVTGACGDIVYDFGDWNGSGAQTTSTASVMNSSLRLGATVDSELSVTPDAGATADGADEDGATVPAAMLVGSSVTIPVAVYNATGAPAYLSAWIDFNGDGTFSDTLVTSGGERLAAQSTVATGTNSTVNLTFTVPSGASLGSGRGVRFRLTSASGAGPTGASGTGEVEDYVTSITGLFDYGDWNGSGALTTTTGSSVNTNLRIGATVDAEASVTPDADATADGADEDGVTVPTSMTPGASVTLPVSVYNATGAPAYLSAWIDFNGDGSFNDTVVTSGGERLAAQSTVATGTNSTVNITFTVPASASVGSGRGVRVRLSSVSGTGPTGISGTGEVEDYVTSIAAACSDFAVLVVNYNNNTITRYSPTTGLLLNSWAPSNLNAPNYVFRDSDGTLLVPNGSGGGVNRFNPTTGAWISTFATGLNFPYQMAIGPDGFLYMADQGAGYIKKYNRSTGALISNIVSGLSNPAGLVFDTSGNILVTTNVTGGSLRKYSTSGTLLQTVMTWPSGDYPRGLAWGPDGRLYVNVYNSSTSRVDVAEPSQGTRTTFVSLDSGSAPYTGIRWSPDGNLYVVDYGESEVSIYTSGGTLLRTITSGLSGPHAVEFVECSTGSATADYGDFSGFADAWSTRSTNLRLGADVDAETVSTRTATANGDDVAGVDDEDGVTMPATITGNTPVTIPVQVYNNSGAAAWLSAWIDFNNDGTLTDTLVTAGGEKLVTPIQVNSSSSVQTVNVTFTPPSTLSAGTARGVRFRLTSTSAPAPTGASGTGEVEDYTVDLAPAPNLGIGNLVWFDANDNGHFDASEGVSGVSVQLYTSANVLVGTTTTDTAGIYHFKDLAAGTYYVKIPATEFASGKPLFGKFSLYGAGGDNGRDDDWDENGIDSATPATTGVSSGNVALAVGTEPTGEAGADSAWDNGTSGNPADADCDLTIDFGFGSCSPTNLLANGSFETAVAGTTFTDVFPTGGSGIAKTHYSTTSNSDASGWFYDQGAYINDATRATDGSKFIYLSASGCAGQTFAVGSAISGLTNLTAGQTYTVTFDWVPFDHTAPNTATSTADTSLGVDIQFTDAAWTSSVMVYQFVDFYDTQAGDFLINPRGRSTWSNLAWKRSRFQFTVPPAPSGKPMMALFLSSGGTSPKVLIDNVSMTAACNPQVGSVGNFVFSDVNGNGLKDGSDVGVDNVLVNLWRRTPGAADTLVGQGYTVNGGQYFFSGLRAANYFVQIAPENFLATRPSWWAGGGTGSSPLYGKVSSYGARNPDVAAGSAADDDVSEVGVDNAAPATNGIASGVFALAPGTEPVSSAGGKETGVFNTLDDANDANGDMTIDFAFAPSTSYDFGDYNGFATAANGVDTAIRMGTNATDAESASPANATALGDDSVGTDDEDINIPSVPLGSSTTFTVPIYLGAAGTASFAAWADWNGDGRVDGPAEVLTVSSSTVTVAAAGTTNVTVTLAPPVTTTIGTKYLRLRVMQGSTPPPFSQVLVTKGEVEDYAVNVTAPVTDFGDWAGSGAATTTTSSIASNNIRLGATVDTEATVTPDAAATADGADEDGVTMPATIMAGTSVTIPVSVFNNNTAGRSLKAWIDFNNDGVFTDSDVASGGERIYNATVGANAAQQTVNVTFTVPSTASVGTQRGVRFRFTDSTATTPTSSGANGEIEDYVVTIVNGTDFGDWAGSGAQTTSASTIVNANIRLGATVDAETSVSPDAGATADGADEDGVTLPASLMVGLPANIPVVVFNNNTAGRTLQGWIDFNNDGTFTDSDVASGGERVYNATVPASAAQQTVNVGFTVPAGASIGTQRGVRFRFTDNAATTPTSAGATGETEDYVVAIVPQTDMGDWAGSGAATGTASSLLSYNVRLGAVVDAESSVTPDAAAKADDLNGLVNDEDGVTMPASVMQGVSVTIPVSVFNNNTAGRYLQAWIDFNNDGIFTDNDVTSGGERVYNAAVAANPAQQTVNVTFTVPSAASVGTQRGVRFRFSDNAATTPTSTGATGEIEDYVVTIVAGTDFGDWAGSGAATTTTSSIVTANLRLGATIDAETSVTPDAAASADGADEDGVTMPATLTPGQSVSIPVTVFNNSGATAYLNAWVDFNGDGSFTDVVTTPAGTGEKLVSQMSVSSSASSQSLNVTFTVPDSAVAGSGRGVRFRLTSTQNPGPTGAAGNGEVEDYTVTINPGLDFGDAPASYGVASHVITPGLKIGVAIDADFSSRSNATATGDDAAGAIPDDEDGVYLDQTLVPGREAALVVSTTGAGVLNAWIDFNADGDFADSGEQIASNVATGAVVAQGQTSPSILRFTVPTAATSGNTFVRVRFTSGTWSGGPTGAAPNGEVEDMAATISPGASLGGRLWADVDGNGLRGATEPAAANLVLTLTRGDGKVEAITSADASGNYSFSFLPAGSYTVHVQLASGVTLSAQDQGTDDTVDSDFNPTTATTASITLAAGGSSPRVDAGLRGVVDTSGGLNTLTQAAVRPFSTTDWSQDFSLPKFDPALGQLVGVEVRTVAVQAVDLHVENHATSAASTTIGLTGSLDATVPSGSAQSLPITGSKALSLATFDGNLDMHGTSGSVNWDVFRTRVTAVTTPTDLSVYTGASGTVTVPASTSTGSSISGGGGNLSVALSQRVTAIVTVSYSYRPFDFGDSTLADASAAANVNLRLGTLVDTESAAQKDATATADDQSGVDDEDGATMPATITQGAPVTIPVSVFNNTGSPAYLTAWIDLDRNGTLDSTAAGVATLGDLLTPTAISVPSNASAQTVNVAFTVPVNASLGSAAVRFRLSTLSAVVATGLSGQGEVEDYMVTVVEPTTDFGDYPFASASSTVDPNLTLGATVDREYFPTTNVTATGDDTTGSDDEDGVTMPATITPGRTVTIPVTVVNKTGAAAYLNAWIDFNNDGTLSNSLASANGERLASQVTVNSAGSAQTVNVTFLVPTNASIGATVGARFWLTSVSNSANATASGTVGNGEVEDYTVVIATPASDHGDALLTDASSYYHERLRLGTLVDTEASATMTPTANGDDNTGSDDEEAVVLPSLIRHNQSVTFSVSAFNNTGFTAYLSAWIDFNNDGTLNDTPSTTAGGELIAAAIPVASQGTQQSVSVAFTVPQTASVGTRRAVRFRLTHTNVAQASDAVGFGEVEDYTITIAKQLAGSLQLMVKKDTDGDGVGDTFVANAALDIYPLDLSDLGASAVTGADGTATITGLTVGSYNVVLAPGTLEAKAIALDDDDGVATPYTALLNLTPASRLASFEYTSGEPPRYRLRHTLTFQNDEPVPLKGSTNKTLPANVQWDTSFTPEATGGVTWTGLAYDGSTVRISGLVVPPGTSTITLRTRTLDLAVNGSLGSASAVSVESDSQEYLDRVDQDTADSAYVPPPPPDVTAPTTTLSLAGRNADGSYTVRAVFSEPVVGVEASDFQVTEGNVTDVTGSNQDYTLTVTPPATGTTLNVLLKAGTVSDPAGNQNALAPFQFTR